MSDHRRRTAGPTGFSTTGTRTALGYWIPLAVTVTVATIGLAAWVWSERSDSVDADDDAKDRDRDGPITLEDTTTTTADDTTDDDARGHPDNASVLARVHSALRRTPSPQQIFDGASRRVVAGMTAAGAVFGGALGAIHEEGNGDFEDHSRWAEPTPPAVLEGTNRGGGFTASGALRTDTPKARQSVAIVVSAVPDSKGDLSEHASILSRLPEYIDPAASKVFVLIYSPGAQPPSSENLSSSRPTLSIASSYDNIAREEAESPNPDVTPVEPQPAQDDAESSLFKALYSQAQVLVDKDTMIMPFNTPNGHVHILRHLSPDIVYIQDSLSGDTGEVVQNISGWVRLVVIVTTGPEKEEHWWKHEGAIGRRTAVVDVASVGEDWRARMSP